MTFPIPDIMVRSIYELTPDLFLRRGIRLVMADLDNTLSPYHVHEADGRLRDWVDGLRAAGLEVFILSNNHGQRPEHFARQLGVGYVNRARKPRPETALSVLGSRGLRPEQAALIGDQIYTDVLCARRCGMFSVCVRPICMSRNPLLAVRYFFEFPFRLVRRVRDGAEKG